MNSFLISFIEQNPSPEKEGLKRIVRSSRLVEKILGMVPADIRILDTDSEFACVFSPDEATWAKDFQFLQVTFHGIELDLIILDVLTYSVVNLMFDNSNGNPYVSALVTYGMHLIRTFLRRFFGTRNLAKKSFIDQRFLC